MEQEKSKNVILHYTAVVGKEQQLAAQPHQKADIVDAIGLLAILEQQAQCAHGINPTNIITGKMVAM